MRTARHVTAFALLSALTIPAARAADDSVANEFRLILSPYHRITDKLTGFGTFAYYWNPDRDFHTYQFAYPGLNYSVNRTLQLAGGLDTRYTNDEESADRLELRPFAGVKLLVPNQIKWNIYNYSRYEHRVLENLDTHDWSHIDRIRSQFGVEFPLTSQSRAWQPKTWYGLAFVEPFYRFDTDRIDPLRLGTGIGYIVNDDFRLEFTYYAQFTRPAGSSSPEYTDNIFRLNLKIGLHRGLLGRLIGSHHHD